MELGRDEYSYKAERDHLPDETPCRCGSCGAEWRYDQLGEIGDCSLTPGHPSPAGRCADQSCDSLAYPMVEAPETVRLYLNLDCGEHCRDHLIRLDIGRAELSRLQELARSNRLAQVAIQPDVTVIHYDSLKEAPTDGVLGDAAAQELGELDEENHNPETELETYFTGELLHVSPNGWCVIEGHDKHSGAYRGSESFTLAQLDAALTAAEAVA